MLRSAARQLGLRGLQGLPSRTFASSADHVTGASVCARGLLGCRRSASTRPAVPTSLPPHLCVSPCLQPPTVKLLIDGKFVESKTKDWIDVRNPATQVSAAVVRSPCSRRGNRHSAVYYSHSRCCRRRCRRWCRACRW